MQPFNALVEILIPIAFFALVVLVIYFISKYQYLTRKAIIDKGGDVDIPKKKLRFLEIGGIVLGLGIGLAVSVLFQGTDLPIKSKDMLTGASILVFGGLGLLITNLFRRKFEQEEQHQ